MRFIKIIVISQLFLFFYACKKKEIDQPIINTSSLSDGILLLNEGLFQYNNASLHWISTKDNSINTSFFEQKANRYLGDTGNDLKRYGDKIYVVVNVSGTIEVLNAKTGSSIKQISMLNNSQNKQPRFITFFGKNAFVSCFDGYVDVIDTTSLSIIQRIKVGQNPDQIIASENKVIVSNSGGLNAPLLDSTISIIDPINLLEEQKIVVGKNPGDLEIINNQLFVIARGNYTSVPAKLIKVNLTNYEVTDLNLQNPLILEKMDDNLLISYQQNQNIQLGIWNSQTYAWENSNFIDLSSMGTLYQIQYEEKNERIYLFDAKDYTISGELLEFSKSGNKLNTFGTGLIPNSLIFF